MAELIYDKTGRLLFTEEMKKDYTLLVPQMLPIHFSMMVELLRKEGFHAVMLNTHHRGIVDEGLKYVHNDTCFPALLVIGQLIDAVKNGGYNPHKVALVITQTGGGCRASNYIHLLRKALEKADMAYIPVISVNLSGLEKNPGFKLSLNFLRKAVFAMMYGDIIMNVANQVRPYEITPGDTDRAVDNCIGWLIAEMDHGKGLSYKSMCQKLPPHLRPVQGHLRHRGAKGPCGRGGRDLRQVLSLGKQQPGGISSFGGRRTGRSRPHRLYYLQDP